MGLATINERDVYAAHASAAALGAAMVAFFHDEPNRSAHLDTARNELTRAANALGCTVKPDTGTMVLMQATEMKMLVAQDRHVANVFARAADADHLRRQLAEETGKLKALETKVWILELVEQGHLDEIARLRGVLDDRSKEWTRLEDKALWSRPAVDPAREAA